MVFLKVSLMKGIVRIGNNTKLNPHYMGPYKILERIGLLAYRLAVPPDMGKIHNMFHVSQLKKYIPDSSHILSDSPSRFREIYLMLKCRRKFRTTK